MSTRQEALERLFSPLRGTLETRGENESTWSRAHVTLRMNLWWSNIGRDDKNEKKLNKLFRSARKNEVDIEREVLSGNEEHDWWDADEHLMLVRNKDFENKSQIEWLSGNSAEPKTFKVVSNGKKRIFRSEDASVAKMWKQAIKLRLISLWNLVEIGSESFKKLFVPHCGSTPLEAGKDNETGDREERGRRKKARMQCCKFMSKELGAGLDVWVKVEKNSRRVPKELQTAADVTNLLGAAPYIGYAFRIVGLGLELVIRLAEENQALEKAHELFKKIVKKVVRALIYAKKSGDGVGLYDFLHLIEKCEEIGHQVEMHGFRSTGGKIKNILLGKKSSPSEIISELQALHDDLKEDLALNTYHHVALRSTREPVEGRESSSRSKNVSTPPPWPGEIPISDDGAYVGNSKLLRDLSEILAESSKRAEEYPKDEWVVQKCIVSSAGGMGKTELVKQYARTKRKFYAGGVYWVEAEQESALLKSFKKIRDQVGLFGGYDGVTSLEDGGEIKFGEFDDHKQLKADCEEFFRRLGQEKGAWLIIFDNADEINGDGDFRLKWIPQRGFGDVLVTTRLQVDQPKLSTFKEGCSPAHVMDDLKKLEVTDARSLLLSHARIYDEELSDEESYCIEGIVGPKNLDGHPLAIVQAGRYIKATSRTFKEYTELLDRPDEPELIVCDEDEEEEKRSILRTFLPSKRKLSDAAKELLSILCWLPPDGIAERDLWNCADPSLNAFPNSSLQAYFGKTEKRSGIDRKSKKMRGIKGVFQSFKRRHSQRTRKDKDDFAFSGQEVSGRAEQGSDNLSGSGESMKWIKVVGEVCKYGLIQRVRKGEEVVICAHRLVYAVERESLKKAEQESRLRWAIVTAIMLLQHHLQMPKNNSKTIPCSEFHEKHNYSKSYSTAELHNELGYFLETYDTYSYGEVFRLYQYAANLEDPTAIYNLALLYEKGNGVKKDEKRGAELYGKAAELGHAGAMYNLGVMYVNGNGVKKDEKRAAELYGKAAKLGHAGAMYNLGVMYDNGNGVKKDEKRGAELYGKAAKLGHADAMYNLGVMYENGNGVKKDEKRAAELYGKAARLEDAGAMYNLGVMYVNGNGVEKDERRSAELYGKAAKLGHAGAMYNLGVMYENGNGVEKDEKRAAELYGKAAELGHADAIYNLGVMYENGNGVEKDEKRAAELYGKAAELGHADAIYNLGVMYVNGNGVEKDEKRAAELYGKAAKLEDAGAIYNLGVMYVNGNGVEKDEKRAAELYGKAAKLGHADAMYNLGVMYENGNGVEKDEKRGAELYGKAAELGHAGAMYNLGVMYVNGNGVEKDEKRAAELYGKAAKLGHADAIYNLGVMYVNGNGVEKDERRSAELYSRAVELGNTWAMNNLGHLYKEGRGVKKDESRADELFRMARSLGGSQ